MKKRIISLLCVAALVMGSLVACGGNDENKDTGKNTENVGNQKEDTESGEGTENVGGEGTEEEGTQIYNTDLLEKLKASYPAEDNFLVLSGMIGGWAPVVMVLDNDGNFSCVVDYAGQAIVTFAQGTYTVNADGSITAEGTQYNTGEELIYEISVADGVYSVMMPVPDTGAEGEITGTK